MGPEARCSLEIRGLCAPDVELEDWRAGQREEAWLDVEVEVGESGTAGATSFWTAVATPEAAALRGQRFERRGLILVAQLRDPRDLHEGLQRVLDACAAENWDASLEQLRKRMHWEYEGMAPQR